MFKLSIIFISVLFFSFNLSANSEGEKIPAEKSLQWLKNGNIRYQKMNFRNDSRDQTTRRKLSKGQHPHSIILSCSDSRVPAEMIFDQALGEVFVVRVAGEALDSSVIASIEYAVEHLGPQLLVVMGHTSCGAVKAAMQAKNGVSVGSPSLDKLVADIKPRLPDRTVASDNSDIAQESLANAVKISKDLSERSAIIKHAIDSGHFKIVPALYHIDSGVVDFH